MRRIGIQVPPKAVSFNGDIPSAPVLGAFEDGMLDKMANSVQFCGLVPGSPADPNAGGDRPESRHVFRQDGYPVREFCRFNLVYHSFLETLTERLLHRGLKGELNPSTA